MSAALEIEDLHKHFGGVTATDSVTLTIEAGETHAIIGPNGAGKTTLLAQLTGNVLPDSGTIRFRGRDITRLPPYRRSALGLARSFQITNVFHDLTVVQNVALGVQSRQGHSYRFWKPAGRDARLNDPAMALLARVSLQAKAQAPAHALSHGERRQLEIAMALATEPELLLLDEPMAGMGPEESSAMVEILSGLKAEKTIVLVEHDLDAVFALADRVSVLVFGRVIASGLPEEVRRNPEVREAYLGEEWDDDGELHTATGEDASRSPDNPDGRPDTNAQANARSC